MSKGSGCKKMPLLQMGATEKHSPVITSLNLDDAVSIHVWGVEESKMASHRVGGMVSVTVTLGNREPQ